MAAHSLSYLGKDALPPLIKVLADRARPMGSRFAAASALRNMGYLGSNAIPAVPVLLDFTKETNNLMGSIAGQALLSFVVDRPGIIIPHESDWAFRMPAPDVVLRRCVITNISALETRAEWARTILTAALLDPDESIKAEATKALEKMGESNASHVRSEEPRTH